jgi:hypothetical protein
MTTTIQDAVLSHLPSKKPNSKGWISFNAICCPHNGETMDTRGRGGVVTQPDGAITYHCFNCNFTTGYLPGSYLGHKFRKLLHWLNVDDNTIQKLAIDAMREREKQQLLGIIKPDEPKVELKVDFKKFPLPKESVTFMGLVEFYELKDSVEYPEGFVKAVEYVEKRKINMRKYDFYWSPDIEHKMDKRVIIPFTWKDEVIGYTARAMIDGIKPKYWNQVDTGFVFNIDKQQPDSQFVIVSEGIFDALSVDGVAVMQADITKQQIDLIESLDREIIVVPDWNKSGDNLIQVALENHWSVSFPVWSETCEDINEAVQKYGKLFVMKTILDSVERSQLKIKLKRKQFRS